MPGALNLVEILASVYLLAIIGALAYADVRALMAKCTTTHLFPGRAHRGRRGDGGPARQESVVYLSIKPGRWCITAQLRWP